MKKRILTHNPEGTIQVGMEIGKDLKGNETVALFGELGAGKTTLIKGIALGLGIEKMVRSPSFIIINEYKTRDKKIYHIDLYRLKDFREAEAIGLFDYLSLPGIKLIEWADRIEEHLPKETIKVKIEVISENERVLSIINPFGGDDL